MGIVAASGLEALRLTTDLLHRVRLADPDAGVWEAADLQWWWRTPRRSDELEQHLFVDAAGPLAAVTATAWGGSWGLDPIAAPGGEAFLPAMFGETLGRLEGRRRNGLDGADRVETLVRDDDRETAALVASYGFAPTDDHGGTTWMAAADRPAVAPPAEGFELLDRTQPAGPHPMIGRNGADAEARLRQVSLYDPALDLSIRMDVGEIAGYALFWFDPFTRVGLVEPMRVEDAWQRRGLARALLTAGIGRLAERGATRIKVGWAGPAGRALYLDTGFVETVTVTTWGRDLA